MKIKQTISTYRKTFKEDLSGALLAAIIGLPMGLAFGVQSGLGAQAGIYTAIILALVASFFGGTRTLISDPTGPMTVVAATVVTMGLSAAGDLANAWPLIVGTFVLAGIFELLFGIFDIGKYVKFMPYPVLSGFMAGIGVIIISVQLFPILGHASPKGFVNIISTLGDPISNMNVQAFGLGALTIAIIYLFPLITKKIPSILVALIVCTILSVTLNLQVPVIGEIPTAMPVFHMDKLFSLTLTDFSYIIGPAIMLGALGVIDSLLTSVVADNLTNTKHDSRWTVIGQGVGNIVVALFGGIPGAGATMGTVTNIKAGAQSKMSGIMKGVILLLILVCVADYVAYIPMSVLAGILITIGIGIIDYKGIRMLAKIPRQDAAVWCIVLGVTVFDNLLNAVAIGFGLSAVLFIGRMSKNMSESQSIKTLSDVIKNNQLPSELADKICVLNLEGPLFFGFSDRFRKGCEEISGAMTVILRMERVPFLDQSGMITLEQVIKGWHQKGIQLYMTGANKQVGESLINVGIIPTIVKDEHCFDNFDVCVMNIGKMTKGKSNNEEFEKALIESHILKNRDKLVHA